MKPIVNQLPQQFHSLDGLTSAFTSLPTKKTIDSGMVFLVGELEKRDPKLYEPLTSTSWPRDMPVRTGGGFVENVTAYNVDYATSGGNNDGIQGKQTNSIPVMQADIGRDAYRVFNWSHILKVPFIDQQMLQKIGRSLDDILDRGIHLAKDKIQDVNVYIGLQDYGSYGLVNSPKIVVVMARNNAAGTSTQWEDKAPEEILYDFNYVLNATWEASEYDPTGMANHILIPPEKYAYINTTPVSAAGSASILTYLRENNIAHNQHLDLEILPCRWCKGAGAGGTNRLVAYNNNVDRVRMDETVPLQRVMTQPDASQMAYLTPYISQFSEVQWVYDTHATYMDGI